MNFPEQQSVPQDATALQRNAGWWRRFRNTHSYGLWLRVVREFATFNVRNKEVRGVRLAQYKVTSKSINTCTVGSGDVLRATLLMPEEPQGPWPCILMRTPYGRKSNMGQRILAERGYAVIVQDTRGRFSSDGQFVPVQHERQDGPTTVEWIRQQPWCNGKVGVVGISYLGFTAWACVDGANVDAIVPVITQSSVKSAVFHPKGAVSFELISLWFYLVAHLMTDMHHDPWSFVRKFWTGFRQGTVQQAMSHLPMNELDRKLLGYKHDFLQAGLAAQANPEDTFWDDKDKLCNFEKPVPPCHILTGWYDFFLEGALEDYARAKKQQQSVWLTVGPFAHWGLLGSRRLYYETMLSCFDQALRCKHDGDESELPVRLYVLGSGWHRYAHYPPPSSTEHWILKPDFSLHKCVATENLEPLKHKYFYDPANPTPSCGGPSFNILNQGASSQARIEARSDVLVYSTQKQEVPFFVIGPVLLRLKVSFELASVDLVGRLCHVDAAGVSTNLCEGLTTISSTNLDGTSIHLEVAMSSIAFLVRSGECLRLHVCSAAHPRWCRNLGNCEPIGSACTWSAGHVEVHSGELLLPIAERQLPAPILSRL